MWLYSSIFAFVQDKHNMYLQVKHKKGQQSQFMKKKNLMPAIYNALVKVQLFAKSFMSRNAHHTYNAQ